MKFNKALLLILLSLFITTLPANNPDKIGKEIAITGNTDQLKYFFSALKKSKTQKVRIAHYGDSIILGDIMTEYLRYYFQSNYGGNGIGYVDIYSNANRMRKTIEHNYSDGWTNYALNTRNSENIPLGISGSVSVASDKCSVTINSTNFMKVKYYFDTYRLFYANPGNSAKVKITVDGKANNYDLKSSKDVNEIFINSSNMKDAKAEFINAGGTFVFGQSFETKTGVIIDNFPISGNSGVSLLDIPEKILISFKEILDYKLIILNYGVNVATPNKNIFKIYENKMLKVIDYLKRIYPESSILIVSVGDKTVKKGSKFSTDENIPLLLETQKNIAEKGKVAFWNLWETMGGKDSMNDWVNNSPPLALKDYTHFTHEGGEKVAGLLYSALMKEYAKFK